MTEQKQKQTQTQKRAAIEVETLLEDDAGNLDNLFEDNLFKGSAKIHEFLGDGKYFNAAACVVSISTISIPKYPNRYKTRFWYLDRHADFIMYLRDGQTDEKIGFWWIKFTLAFRICHSCDWI